MAGLLTRSHASSARLTLAVLSAAAGLAAALPAQAGDAAAGKSVFTAQCSTCHTATKGGATVLGPNLFGVVGRPVASMKGFAYSKAMLAYGGTWTSARLRSYLPGPMQAVPGTKMTYGGVKNPEQLDNLLAYLESQK